MNTPSRVLLAASLLLTSKACRPAEVPETEFTQGNALIQKFQADCDQVLAENDGPVRDGNSFWATSGSDDANPKHADHLYVCRCQIDDTEGTTCESEHQHDLKSEASKKTDTIRLSANSMQHVLEKALASSQKTLGEEKPLTAESDRIEVFQGNDFCTVETQKKLIEGRTSKACMDFIEHVREIIRVTLVKLSKNARTISEIMDEAAEDIP